MRRAGTTLHCGARASHCGGFSCCGARALGAQASVVVAHGLSYSACGIFPDQGSNLCSLHWQADSCPLRHQGSPILPFTVSDAQSLLLFLNLLYKAQLLQAHLPSFTLNPLPTLPLCVVFHSYSSTLFLLLSAISWFLLFTLTSPLIPLYPTLMFRQEVSSLTKCLYVPEVFDTTQTAGVIKITVRKTDVVGG